MGKWVRSLRTGRRLGPATVAVGLAVMLGACGQLSDALGQGKNPPDEFQVVARAPLSLPPNYDLRPPRPGAPRPQERSATEAAAERILGRPARATTGNAGAAIASAPAAAVTVSSVGEARFRQQLGLDQAEGGIRSIVDQETAAFVYEAKYPIDYLLFWKEDPPPGVLLDARQEQQRLRENAALGRNPSDGGLPTIQRRRGGLLDGLF